MEEDASHAAGRQHHMAGAMKDPAVLGVTGQHAVDPPVADDQIDGEGLGHHRDRTGAANEVGELVGQDAACGVTPGMDDPRPPMGRFTAEHRRSVGIAVEGRPGGEQPADLVGAFRRQQPGHQGIRDPGARRDGIGGMVARIVVRADRGGHSALCIGAGTAGQVRRLGQQGHRSRRQAQGGGQAGHAGPWPPPVPRRRTPLPC